MRVRVRVIPVIPAALGTVHGSMKKELEGLKISGKIETIQTTTLLKSTRIS